MINKMMAAGCFIALVATPVFAEEADKAQDTSSQQRMMWVFGDVDANKDMKINKEELGAKGGDIAKFKKADINSDGSLDENEFVAYGEEEQ